MQEFVYKLEQCFKQPLPAKKAHIEMLPETKIPHLALKDEKTAEQSSVLIMFYHKNNDIYTLFIKRSTYDGVHSGQIAFPGGKSEPGDKDLAETAIREAKEEIGIDTDNVIIKGKLSEVYISPSNNIVTPFAGIYKGQPQFNPNSIEVNKLIEVSITEVLNKKNKSKAQVKAADGRIYDAPCFRFKNHIIWGATAMMLNEFIVLWGSFN